MIIPVGDINPRRTLPFMNYLLIFANVVVFIWWFFLASHPERERVVQTGLLVPLEWKGAWTSHSFMTLFTSMFLHADLLHLFGNMLFLWIAGDNVEDRLGHVPYVLFYFLCGLAGAATHIYMATGPMPSMLKTPTLGASGAISGVIGAYLVFFPKSKIKFMIWLIIFIRYFTLPSWGAIGFWIAGQLIMAREQLKGLKEGEQMQVAVFAHLGGFLFGVAWALLARLFGKSPPKPKTD